MNLKEVRDRKEDLIGKAQIQHAVKKSQESIDVDKVLSTDAGMIYESDYLVGKAHHTEKKVKEAIYQLNFTKI